MGAQWTWTECNVGKLLRWAQMVLKKVKRVKLLRWARMVLKDAE